MKQFLIASAIALLVALFIVIPQANAVPVSYNQNAISITWTQQARNASVYDAFLETGYNGTATSWFHNTIGGLAWQNKLGTGSSFTAPYAITLQNVALNGSKIFFKQAANTAQISSVDVLTGSTKPLFHSTCAVAGARVDALFMFANQLAAYCLGDTSSVKTTLAFGNVTITTNAANPTVSNQKFLTTNAANRDWYNNPLGTSIGATLSTNQCELTYMPTNATTAIDNIACDLAMPNHLNHYWYGIKPDMVGNYATNSTYTLIQSIYNNPYKTILTLPDVILGITGPDTRFILHANNIDYMFVLTSTKIYYATTASILSSLSGHAVQQYLMTNTVTSSNYEIPTTLLTNAQIYGPGGLNQTISTFGVINIPSGYTLRLSTYSQTTIRTLDPQWTNDNNFYPGISTGITTLFPIILTVNNAPTDGGLKITNPNVNLVYTYEPNLVFSTATVQNTIDTISRTYSSTSTPTYSLTPWGNYAINFTGSNYLRYFQNPNLNFTKSQAFSASFWYNSPAYGILNKEVMGTQQAGSFLGRGWGIWLSSGGGNTATIEFNLVNIEAANYISVTSAVPVTILDSNWHHVVVTYDGSSSASGVKIYLDNSAIATSTFSNTLTGSTYSTNPFTIGQIPNAGGFFLIGKLNEVKVYNTNLISSDVSSLFSHSTVNPTTETFGNEIWTITRLDSTRTAEYDVPLNTCGNAYVADISQYPPIYNYEGSICATGSNVKTISYTNTLPLTFWTGKYGASSSFTPSSNILTTTVRSTTSPFTYNVLIKNSTGSITQNFTSTVNGTIETHNFNTSNTAKSGGVYVSVSGSGLIYSSYFGSPLSLASVVSFFHQYLSYQGFDLLSFIPIIFAAMFTRNTVGIGMALTVVVIATLNFLSVVVVSDIVVYTSVVIAIFGLIGYRGFAG